MAEIDSEPMPEIELKRIERRIILTKLFDAVEWLHKKATKGRIHEKDVKIVKARVDVFKALGYVANVYNQVARDEELEEIKAELEELKELLK